MDDVEHMRRAMAQAATVRSATAPNPWVGCVVVPPDSARTRIVFAGATAPPGGPHAEVTALAEAGEAARGATLYITLEPCAHHGRTPPCTDAIIDGGRGPGRGRHRGPRRRRWPAGAWPRCGRPASRSPSGVAADEVAEQLAPYRKHRTTGQPWVVLKMAASLDGRTAAPDGTSRWITGEAARRDVHRLRARSDAVLVGAGTVRADDPELTVRLRRRDRAGPAAARRARAGSGRRQGAPGPRARRATWGTCSTSSAAAACSSCWSRAGPRWPTTSTPPAWSTATCCTWRRCSSGATTAARFSRAPGLAQLETCGRAGWCRWNSWVRIFEWRWRPDGVLEVQEAIDSIARLGMAVVVDDEDRENEGDLVMAAEAATPENIAFFLAHTSGRHLRAAPARAGRRARPAAHGHGQHRGAADRLHGERRLPPRHDDGHLRRGPGVDHRRPDRPPDPAQRPEPARPHLPVALPDGRACSSGPGTPRRRST